MGGALSERPLGAELVQPRPTEEHPMCADRRWKKLCRNWLVLQRSWTEPALAPRWLLKRFEGGHLFPACSGQGSMNQRGFFLRHIQRPNVRKELLATVCFAASSVAYAENKQKQSISMMLLPLRPHERTVEMPDSIFLWTEQKLEYLTENSCPKCSCQARSAT